MRLRSLLLCLCLAGMSPLQAFALPSAAGDDRRPAYGGQPPPGDFVPVEDAPPGEQIPALPLLASAYGFIWVALLGYVWTIGRRLQQVEGEIRDLESRRP